MDDGSALEAILGALSVALPFLVGAGILHGRLRHGRQKLGLMSLLDAPDDRSTSSSLPRHRGRKGRGQPPPSLGSSSVLLQRHATPSFGVSMGDRPLDDVQNDDPTFSVHGFMAFVLSLHRAAALAGDEQAWHRLGPYFTEPAAVALRRANDAHPVDDVLLGHIRAKSVLLRGTYNVLRLELTVMRHALGAGPQGWSQATEHWTLRRSAGAHSVEPELAATLGCPGCGAPIQTDAQGRCGNCDRGISWGQLQWQVVEVQVEAPRTVEPPQTDRALDDPSTDVSSRANPALSIRLRRFQAENPQFDASVFGQQVELLVAQVTAAWTARSADALALYLSPHLFARAQFALRQLELYDLQDPREDVTIERSQLTAVTRDGWYDYFSVRLWLRMRDVVLDGEGRLVAGDPDAPRRLSQVWTLMRPVGQPGVPWRVAEIAQPGKQGAVI